MPRRQKRSYRRRWRCAVLAALLLVLGTGCDGGTPPTPVSMGAFNFSESLILAEVYAQALRGGGVPTTAIRQLTGREGTFPALELGEIDFLPEYNGNALDYITDGKATDTDPEVIAQELRDRLAERGLVALESSPAENRDELVVTAETAERYELSKVSDLAPVAHELTVGGPVEFAERNTGLRGLREMYGIEFGEFIQTDAGGVQTVTALQEGKIDVARLFSTNPLIEEHNWVVLAEDKPFSLPNSITPIVRADVLTDEMAEIINAVSAALTTEDLVEFNRRFTLHDHAPRAIAQDFLEANDLD